MKIVKQRKLAVTAVGIFDLEPFFAVIGDELPGEVILVQAYGAASPSLAGDEIPGPLEHDAEFFQHIKIQGAVAAGFHNPPGGFDADPRYPQKVCIACPANLYREFFQMAQGPVAFGIQQQIKMRALLRQQFVRRKTVIAQQPVRLIEPVFPEGGCRH